MSKPPPQAREYKKYQSAAEAALSIGSIFKYLKSMSPHRIVGVTCDAGNCPLSNYMRDMLGLSDAEQVDTDGDWITVRTQNTFGEYKVEADVNLIAYGWPRQLIRHIDGAVERGVHADITAGQALDLLRELK